jgi:tRNA modification GTPase
MRSSGGSGRSSSPSPGTTRDLVDGEVIIAGVAVRLIDGAGQGMPRDMIDAEGMARSRRATEESDLVLVVLDRSRARAAVDADILELTAGPPTVGHREQGRPAGGVDR